MVHSSCRIGKSKLSYVVYGHGQHVLLLFHGFGQNKSLFEHAPEVIQSNYKLIAIDLFGHGDSTFYHQKKVPLKEWGEYIDAILTSEKVTYFSILGFSLGARIAIHTAYLFKERIQSLTLLAPDGIVTSKVYKLATTNWLFKRLFHSFVFNPGIYRGVIKVARKLRFIDSYTTDFFLRVLNQKSRRYKLYRVWNMYSLMTLPFQQVEKTLPIKPSIFLAKRDLLVKNKQVKKVCENLGLQITILDTSHFGIVDQFFSNYKNVYRKQE